LHDALWRRLQGILRRWRAGLNVPKVYWYLSERYFNRQQQHLLRHPGLRIFSWLYFLGFSGIALCGIRILFYERRCNFR
jgi:hypothetical protein